MRDIIKKICIVRLSAIGDVTLCLPLINTIKHFLPNAEITWITSPESYSLLHGIKDVEFVQFHKKFGFKSYFDLYKLLRKRNFDCLLALQASWRANFIYPLVKAPIKIGFDKNRSKDCQFLFVNKMIEFKENQHLLDSYLEFLKPLGLDPRCSLHAVQTGCGNDDKCHPRESGDPKIEWNFSIDEERKWAKVLRGSISSKLLLINPSASKKERTWRTERYIEVIKESQKRWNLHIILTGGSNRAEIKTGNIVEKEIKSGITNLIGKTTLKQFVALTEVADVALSPDTAAVHFATASGTPVVGLYAVAPPEVTGPYADQRFIIDKFPEAVRKYLRKEPESLKWGTRVHSQKAMDLISVDEVLQKLEEAIQ